MQYVLLIFQNPEARAQLTEAEEMVIFGEYNEFTEKTKAAGAFLYGDPLQGPETATVVRVQDGNRTVTDGPFVETKEVLVGYYELEADSLDEALDWAAQIPDARFGGIEVRPVMQLPG